MSVFFSCFRGCCPGGCCENVCCLDERCPFKDDELGKFFNWKLKLGSDAGIYTNISKERLISVLNGIMKDPQGENLLKILKNDLETKGKKISFVTCCGCEEFKQYNDDYAFKSDYSSTHDNILVVVKNEKPESMERFCFDGQSIKQYTIPGSETENYAVSHELVHVISYLESGVLGELGEEDKKTYWSKRKNNWDGFLETDRMRAVKDELLRTKTQDGNILLKDEEIIEFFRCFFTNTEEARNLLGFKPKRADNETIGEFTFFNDKCAYYLPIYARPFKNGQECEELTEKEKTVLRVIARNLGINLQVANWMCNIL